jgi:hypothetical protein
MNAGATLKCAIRVSSANGEARSFAASVGGG